MILLYDCTVPTCLLFVFVGVFVTNTEIRQTLLHIEMIPCSAISVEEHMKRSWPSSWSGLFSQRVQ